MLNIALARGEFGLLRRYYNDSPLAGAILRGGYVKYRASSREFWLIDDGCGGDDGRF